MVYEIETDNLRIALKMERVIRMRDWYKITHLAANIYAHSVWNPDGPTGSYSARMSGETVSGRTLEFRADFPGEGGVLTIYAPDSKGGILETIFKEMGLIPHGEDVSGKRYSFPNIMLGDIDTRFDYVDFSTYEDEWGNSRTSATFGDNAE